YLQSGERHTGTIGVGQQHLIQFHAEGGGQVYATLGDTSATSAAPQIRIVDPAGNVVSGTSTWENVGLQVGFQAIRSGLYTAVLSDYGADNPLDYTFSVASLPGAVDYSLPGNAYL